MIFQIYKYPIKYYYDLSNKKGHSKEWPFKKIVFKYYPSDTLLNDVTEISP